MSHQYFPSEERTRKPTPLGKPSKHHLVPIVGFAPFLLCVAVFLSAPSLTAQIIGYVHRGSYLFELYLEGENPIVWRRTTVPLGGSTRALAFNETGELYAENQSRLVRIDPASGEFEIIGPFVPWGGGDLTFDDQGTLWMIRSGLLFLVDTETAVTTEVPIAGPPLLALGFYGGALQGIVSELQGNELRFDLITIDPIAGTMESVAELSGFFQAPCWHEGPVSMDFDRQGGLWVVVLGGETCILPAPVINYLFFPNPADGISEPRLWLADGPDGPIYVGSSLAIQDRAAIVEIPTLNPWGSLAFLLILGSVGWVRLRSLAPGTSQTKSAD